MLHPSNPGEQQRAEQHKIAGDVLKLITLGKVNPAAHLVLAFADEDAAKQVKNKGWLAEAVVTWGIEVLVIDLPDDVLDGLRAVQRRQVLVNPAEAVEPVSVEPVDFGDLYPD